PRAGVYDETIDAAGQLRPAWQSFMQGLDARGASELQRRWEQAQRQIRHDGFSFNPYDEGGEVSRPWVLDAIPLLLAEQEWREIELGLAQRARLLDLILHDLFGAQQLLRDR